MTVGGTRNSPPRDATADNFYCVVRSVFRNGKIEQEIRINPDERGAQAPGGVP